ncbi:flagellar assembly protein FliW [Candidatus Neomarinimicrobiota bacterium]
MTDPETLQQEQTERSTISDPFDFPAGLPGFEEHKQYVLIGRQNMRPFQWLRAVDDDAVSLPVISCLLLNRNCLPQLKPDHMDLLGEPSRDKVAPFFVLRVNTADGTITANTKAPIIINLENMQGYQVIVDGDHLRVDEPLADLVPKTGK